MQLDPSLDSAEFGDSRAEALAVEYVRKSISGEPVDRSAYLRFLGSTEERSRFLELVGCAEEVDRLLPRPVREGTVLSGRYRVDQKLGEGGMGRVFRGYDLNLKRRVAIKVLGAPDLPGLDADILFTRESELLASLQHPGIVAIHECGRDDEVRYIVMDLVEGTSLDEVLERLRSAAGDECVVPRTGAALLDAIDVPLPDGCRPPDRDESWERAVSRLMAEICRTLEAAHGKDVVHRDIKPGNTMLRGDGSPVLLDFGLGGRSDRATGDVTRKLFGSAAYVAPEQVLDQESGNDPRSDLYKLGVMFYELLTLRRAFEGDDVTAVLQRIVTGEFRRPRLLSPAIPVDLEAICLKSMELNPARRYQTVGEFREDLEAFLSGTRRPRAVSGGTVSLFVRDSRYFLRKNQVALQVAAALLLGVLVTFFLVSGLRGAPFEPVVRSFVSAAGTNPVPSNPQVIRAGQPLSVRIDVDRPAWVYACLVESAPDGSDPRVMVLDTVRESAQGEMIAALGQQVAPGSTDLLCAVIRPGDSDAALVRLILWIDERPRPILHTWLSEVQQVDAAGIALRDAEVLAEQLTADSRGPIPLPGLTAEETRVALEEFRERQVELEPDIPFFHSIRHKEFRIRVTP